MAAIGAAMNSQQDFENDDADKQNLYGFILAYHAQHPELKAPRFMLQLFKASVGDPTILSDFLLKNANPSGKLVLNTRTRELLKKVLAEAPGTDYLKQAATDRTEMLHSLRKVPGRKALQSLSIAAAFALSGTGMLMANKMADKKFHDNHPVVIDPHSPTTQPMYQVSSNEMDAQMRGEHGIGMFSGICYGLGFMNIFNAFMQYCDGLKVKDYARDMEEAYIKSTKEKPYDPEENIDMISALAILEDKINGINRNRMNQLGLS
jgi:hypothetical protein